FRDRPSPEICTLSLHDALPICALHLDQGGAGNRLVVGCGPRRRTDHPVDLEGEVATVQRGEEGLDGEVLAGLLECLDEHVGGPRSEEHTSELQSREKLVCRLLL